MNVAFVVGRFPVLSQTFILDQITGLLDRGVNVDIYAAEGLPQPAEHGIVEQYDLVGRTTYAVPDSHTSWKRRAWVLRLFARTLGRSGGPRRGPIHAFRDARRDAALALRMAPLRGNGVRRYDVIHCHFGPNGNWGRVMRDMGVLSGTLVTTFHGYDLSRFLQSRSSDAYQRLFDDGELFLPISDFWRDKLIQLGCSPGKIRVHHMGVDCSSFAFHPRQLPAEGRIQILAVGRLVEKKGMEFAIRAVAELQLRDVEADLTIIGDGPLRTDLAELVERLGLGGRVQLAGAKAREEVMQAMRNAHVLLAPSITSSDGDQEGIPVTIMEAMATGLPVVSTWHTGIPELVEDGETGWLAAERDFERLADILTRLPSAPAEYSRIATAARARVERDFDVAKLNDRLFEIFRRLGN